MPTWLKSAGIGGSILVIIALIITFLKQIIALVAFLTSAIKILIVIAFIAVFALVGYLIFRAWKENSRQNQ
jgi:predicted membrane-bound mannosyltransferase